MPSSRLQHSTSTIPYFVTTGVSSMAAFCNDLGIPAEKFLSTYVLGLRSEMLPPSSRKSKSTPKDGESNQYIVISGVLVTAMQAAS